MTRSIVRQASPQRLVQPKNLLPVSPPDSADRAQEAGLDQVWLTLLEAVQSPANFTSGGAVSFISD